MESGRWNAREDCRVSLKKTHTHANIRSESSSSALLLLRRLRLPNPEGRYHDNGLSPRPKWAGAPSQVQSHLYQPVSLPPVPGRPGQPRPVSPPSLAALRATWYLNWRRATATSSLFVAETDTQDIFPFHHAHGRFHRFPPKGLRFKPETKLGFSEREVNCVLRTRVAELGADLGWRSW